MKTMFDSKTADYQNTTEAKFRVESLQNEPRSTKYEKFEIIESELRRLNKSLDRKASRREIKFTLERSFPTQKKNILMYAEKSCFDYLMIVLEKHLSTKGTSGADLQATSSCLAILLQIAEVK
jgi:hypothetical protein